jgi:hypothetical protein
LAGTKKVDIIDVVILYDKNSGQIQHIHTDAVVPGAKETTKALSEDEILEIAKQKGCDISQLEALHVSHTDLKPELFCRSRASIGFGFRVDVKTKALAEEKLKKS